MKIDSKSQLVAFGIHGGASGIDIVSVEAKTHKLTPRDHLAIGMSSALLHLDWSLDSRYIQVNSQAYELLFVDLETKQGVTASVVKDVNWRTQTCKLGFPVQGIWPGADYTEVNSVARSHNGKILATTEDSGLVKLFRYPCTQEHA